MLARQGYSLMISSPPTSPSKGKVPLGGKKPLTTYSFVTEIFEASGEVCHPAWAGDSCLPLERVGTGSSPPIKVFVSRNFQIKWPKFPKACIDALQLSPCPLFQYHLCRVVSVPVEINLATPQNKPLFVEGTKQGQVFSWYNFFITTTASFINR